MKNTFVGLTLLALVALNGCTQGTPGGPGASGAQPSMGQAEDTFNLSVPMMSSSLQQGAQVDAVVGIKRAKNFDEEVALQFADVPQGVVIEPANPVIKRGDAEAKVVFKAGDEAPIGDFKIKVTGHPTKGGDAEIEFKLTVAAKDTFTLSVPILSTSLKQGSTQTVSIGISRQKSFNEDVALTFGELPTGVTLVLDDEVMKPGDSEANATLTATEDASLGDFAIKVTGHPVQGADATNELNITVVQK